MSSRFHNKFHRHNHHTDASQDPRYPDSGHDPIASQEAPFRGAFHLQGPLSSSSIIQGTDGLFESTINANFIQVPDGFISNLNTQNIIFPFGSSGTIQAPGGTSLFGDLTIFGAITALSGINITSATETTATTLSVLNDGGLGPTFYVEQGPGLGAIMKVVGGNGTEIIAVNNSFPVQSIPALTVTGVISASTAGNSTLWNQGYLSGLDYNTNKPNYDAAFARSTHYVANSSTWMRRAVSSIGNNSNTIFTYAHNLNTRDIITQVHSNTDFSIVYPTIANITTNTISLSFDFVPVAGEFRVVVMG
jgi:hypothetical protein